MSDYTLEEVIDFIEGEIDTAYEAAYYEGGCEDCDDPIECLKEKLKKKIEDDEIKFIKASELEDLIDDCSKDSDDDTDDADEDDTADECGSSCNETVDNVIDAYENGVITYEEAGDYLTLMTEARRLDKEILRKAELRNKLAEITNDESIPKSFRKKIYDKYKNDLELSSKYEKLDRDQIGEIAYMYSKERKKFRDFDDKRSPERTDRKDIAKKLKELKDIKTKKVNTKVNPRDRSLGDELY
jgi:hypothetical protein